MKVVVLAAGFATRLYPLTRERAKPLLEVGGRAVVSRLLDRVLALPGIDDVVVVSNTRFREQMDAWAAEYEADVPVLVIANGARSEEEMRGAARDLALGLEACGRGEEVLVVAGDNLLDLDLAPHLAEFRRRGIPTILVRELAGDVPPRRHGEVTLAGDGTIARFREKPDVPESTLSAICLYFLTPAVRELLDEFLAGGGNPDAPGYFLEWLVARTPVLASRIEGRYFDIGNHETLAAARAAFEA
jgi:glucose-1-phosphate thymidylyltransferase